MIGGLFKSQVSRLALLAAAGFLAGGMAVPSAKAADLGGDCCADLEERVAELEATTARKGNRKMSLTVSGQVTRSMMYWRDDFHHDLYGGLDNHNQSTRFVFSGTARINPNLTAGFEFMTELSGGARTSTVTQLDEDGGVPGDGTLNVRTANWWLEDKTWGRMTVGRINVGGPVATIDLGGISTAAHFAPTLNGGGFWVSQKNNDDQLLNIQYNQLVGPVYGGNRMEGIRYDTPNIMGFIGQATFGEDNHWSASIRYAGDWAGFRVAAGIGVERIRETPGFTSATATFGTGNNSLNTDVTDDQKLYAGSVAIMHTASGLFLQGYYGKTDFERFNTNTGSTSGALFLDGGKKDASIWQLQAGITKNWFGVGNTSVFGEYAVARDYAVGYDPSAPTLNVDTFDNIATLTDSRVAIMGFGVVQQLDAAAMELYVNWRRFSTDIDGTINNATAQGGVVLTTGATATASSPAPGNQAAGGTGINAGAIDMITAGARIRF